jgi:phage tail protein X
MFLTHVTEASDRWDLLAWRYYGDATVYGRLIEANPHIPISPVLPVGATVYIPIIEQAEQASELPPWQK